MPLDKHVVDPEAEANAIIIRCIEKGLRTMGGTAGAIRYIETISGMSVVELPHHPDDFVFALRHVFRYGSVTVLRDIVRELDSSTSDDAEVMRRVRSMSESLVAGIRSIESGVM